MIKTPEDLLRAIRGGERFLLTSHANPDGDAIGSEVGLARILRTLGKGATIWNADPTPRVYMSLPGTDRIHHGAEPPVGFPDSFEALITLECPTLDRCGLHEQLAGVLPILNIDHHLGNEHYGQVNWVDTAAPSLGEMIHRLARALNLSLDQATATSLYLTLVTDTGNFRFANATARAFEAAAELVNEGAQPQEVARWLYESQPQSAIKLLGETLQTLELDADGRIATLLLTLEMSARAGAQPGDSEGLIDVPRSIAGVDAVAVVRETGPGQCKVSLRSRGDVDVERIARGHGGGGHRNAAGFAIEGTCAGVRRSVADQLTAALGG
jgi:phosphoesterase RecJ-like protein